MLITDHFKRPFIDEVLESIKVLNDSIDQDFNGCQMQSNTIYTV